MAHDTDVFWMLQFCKFCEKQPLNHIPSLLWSHVLFCSVLFYSILPYSFLFCSILFYSVLFYSTVLYSILFNSILILCNYALLHSFLWYVPVCTIYTVFCFILFCYVPLNSTLTQLHFVLCVVIALLCTPLCSFILFFSILLYSVQFFSILSILLCSNLLCYFYSVLFVLILLYSTVIFYSIFLPTFCYFIVLHSIIF